MELFSDPDTHPPLPQLPPILKRIIYVIRYKSVRHILKANTLLNEIGQLFSSYRDRNYDNNSNFYDFITMVNGGNENNVQLNQSEWRPSNVYDSLKYVMLHYSPLTNKNVNYAQLMGVSYDNNVTQYKDGPEHTYENNQLLLNRIRSLYEDHETLDQNKMILAVMELGCFIHAIRGTHSLTYKYQNNVIDDGNKVFVNLLGMLREMITMAYQNNKYARKFNVSLEQAADGIHYRIILLNALRERVTQHLTMITDIDVLMEDESKKWEVRGEPQEDNTYYIYLANGEDSLYDYICAVLINSLMYAFHIIYKVSHNEYDIDDNNADNNRPLPEYKFIRQQATNNGKLMIHADKKDRYVVFD